MNIKLLSTAFLITALLFVSALSLNAQSREVFTLTADELANGKTVELDKAGWRFHAGDDVRFAEQNFDDSTWERLDDSALAVDKLSQTDWRGIGWFRLRVQIPSELAGEQLALQMWQWGASEIYIDGKLVHRFGTVGASAESEQAYNPNGVPVGISFGASGEHLIAVRRSAEIFRELVSSRAQWLAKQERNLDNGRLLKAGFKMSLTASDAFRQHERDFLIDAVNRLFRAGLVSAVALLFLLLFYFYPRQKGTMFFGIFAFCLNLNIFTLLLKSVSHFDLTVIVFLNLVEQLFWLISTLFILIFLYSTFSIIIPRYFWIAAAAVLISSFFYIFFPDWYIGFLLSGSMLGFVGIEVLRVTAMAVWQKKDGAWILFVGALIYTPLIFYWSLNDLGITTLPEIVLFVIRQISVIGIVILISIYLARQVAQTNKNLEAKLVEVETFSEREIEHERDKARFLIVEAENERRAKELEEARQLQLSMLPKKLPNIEGLEIAAYMKPATEVGGDYYDFHVAEDGTLTVAVGDATGHGLKAGSVVTATKSLFNAFAEQTDIPQIFRQMSGALKKMNLRGLFMAMTLLKIKNDQASLSIAGMPSALIYRRENDQVEEIAIRAMPLGSLARTNYQEQQFNLSTGDCLVLMSDGFPEMFNRNNEILGFEKASEVLPGIANLSPQEIIDHLVKIGEEWADGRPQDDDVTFVVLKVGSVGN